MLTRKGESSKVLCVARFHENGFEMFCCIYLAEAGSASWQVLSAVHHPGDGRGGACALEHPVRLAGVKTALFPVVPFFKK